MRIFMQEFGMPMLWPLPMLLGLTLIALGLLIIIFPALLAYAVAAFFIMGGISMLGFAFRMRGGVQYRRIHPDSTIVVEDPRL